MTIHWQVPCNLLQTESTGDFLAIQHLAIIALLLNLHLSQLAFLLPLPFLQGRHNLGLTLSLYIFDIFRHFMLVHLVIKYALVRILHLSLVQALLLNLLLRLRASYVFSLPIMFFMLLFFFLLFHCEVGHMFLVNMSLFA